MDTRYERFNEITFNAYCIVSIDRAIARGLRRKKRRAMVEISLSEIEDRAEAAYEQEYLGLSVRETAADTFEVGGMEIPIEDENLAKALRSLPPQKRSIVLLALFLGKTDKEIGQDLSLPRTTVRDRRHEALKRLREMLGDEP